MNLSREQRTEMMRKMMDAPRSTPLKLLTKQAEYCLEMELPDLGRVSDDEFTNIWFAIIKQWPAYSAYQTELAKEREAM